MLYFDPRREPGFRRTIFNAIVTPRPIAWISTLSADGVANLAPFSHFNLVSTAPPMVMVSINTPEDREQKDTLGNIRATGEFVVNFASVGMAKQINASSVPLPHGQDEFETFGIEKAPSETVKPFSVRGAPATLECRAVDFVRIDPIDPGDTPSTIVLGLVIMLGIAPEMLTADGRFDTEKAQPLSRLGGPTYGALGRLFSIAPAFQRAGDLIQKVP